MTMKTTSNAKHPDLGDSEADRLVFRDSHSGVANLLSGDRWNFRDDIRNLQTTLIRHASRILRVMSDAVFRMPDYGRAGQLELKQQKHCSPICSRVARVQ